MMLVLFRIGGLMIFAPVFGSSVIPVRVKVGLALVTSIAVYPLIAERTLDSLHLTFDLWLLAPIVMLDALIGLVVGYLASMPMMAAQAGGLIMGQQMGLGFAQLYNPSIDDEADVVGSMLFYMTLAGFLIVGGHEAMLLSILHSFEHIAPGGIALDGDFVAMLTGVLTASFELALRVAAPLLALVFLESLAMGFIAKTVPQLNILSLGFPMRILIGIAIIATGLWVIDDVLMEGVDDMLGVLFNWTGR